MKPSVLFPVHCLWRVLLLPALAAGVAFAADSTASGWTHFTIGNPLPGTAWGTAGLPLVDLDKDGDLDVALSRRDAHGFYWYERRSDSNWVQHTICEAPDIEQGLGAAALDVDRDGWTDLVFSGVWFRNPGTPAVRSDRPWPHHRFEGGGHDILDADVNGDGREDIVTFDGKTLAWFDTAQNLEKNVLASEIDHHGGVMPRGAGDLDGDGDLDLVIAGSWFENPGKGRGGWSRHAWPHLGVPNASYGISIRSWVVDLDRDGSQDIVYSDCDTGNGHVYWVRNLGRGKEWNRVRLTDPPTGPGNVSGTGSWHSLAVADFDGDGDWDIFGGEQEDPDAYMISSGKVAMKPPGLKPRGVIWVNDGAQPTRFHPVVLNEGNPGWHDAAVGDVDGDGDPDLVSKIWNKDGPAYHADYWRNDRRKAAAGVRRAAASNAWNTVTVTLPAQPSPTVLRPDSPFGINTAFQPDTPDLEARLDAMQFAGIKWGRQDFTWRRIEKSPGHYEWSGYDRLVELCRRHATLLFGDLAYALEDDFDWWMLDQYVKSWNRTRLTPEYPLVHMTYLEQAAELSKVLGQFGTRRHVPFDKVRTGSLPVPLGESPIYIVGARGTRTTVGPDPGW